MKRIILLGIGIIVFGIGAGVANADIGKLDAINRISYLDNVVSMSHAPNSEEGYNSTGNKDLPYGGHVVFNIEGKIISMIDDTLHPELMSDVRPEYSQSVFNCEMSLRSPDGSPMDTESWSDKSNNLEVRFPLSYYFGNEPLTLQITQMNADPNMIGNVYDLRKEIHYGSGTGVIALPDLNGIYNSEEVYGKFSVYFDRNLADFNNDGIINLQDFSLLAQEWGKTGNSLADIAIAVGNIGIVLPGTTTPYFDGVVDIADVMYFADNWLVEY